jgi:hypothetical protein
MENYDMKLHMCQTREHRTAQMTYILHDKGWDMTHALHQLYSVELLIQ